MKRRHYTEKQITFALRQHKAETSILDIVPKMGIAKQTLYRWKRKFVGSNVKLRRKHWAFRRCEIRCSLGFECCLIRWTRPSIGVLGM